MVLHNLFGSNVDLVTKNPVLLKLLRKGGESLGGHGRGTPIVAPYKMYNTIRIGIYFSGQDD